MAVGGAPLASMTSCIMPVWAVTLSKGYCCIGHWWTLSGFLRETINITLSQQILTRPSLRHWDNQQSTTVHVDLREFYACRPWGQVLGMGIASFTPAFPWGFPVRRNSRACSALRASWFVACWGPCFEAGFLLALHLARATSIALALPWCFRVREDSRTCSALGAWRFVACCGHALRPARH